MNGTHCTQRLTVPAPAPPRPDVRKVKRGALDAGDSKRAKLRASLNPGLVSPGSKPKRSERHKQMS
jgi:hypothetical protein